MKGKAAYTCEECDGWWVKTGSAPTTHGSTEIAPPAMSNDQDAVVGAAPHFETAGAWEKVSELPAGVLREWQLRPMTIPKACNYSRFQCGMCGAKWVEAERMTDVRM